MVDFDAIAVTGAPADESDLAFGGRINRSARGPLEIEPGMEGWAAREWVGAIAKA